MISFGQICKLKNMMERVIVSIDGVEGEFEIYNCSFDMLKETVGLKINKTTQFYLDFEQVNIIIVPIKKLNLVRIELTRDWPSNWIVDFCLEFGEDKIKKV